MKLSALKRRIAHLNSIVTWCKVVAGFILLILFKQEEDEDRALNQAIAAICVLTISMYIFAAIIAWSLKTHFIRIVDLLEDYNDENDEQIKNQRLLVIVPYYIMHITLLLAMFCSVSLLCMQCIEVLGQDRPEAAWTIMVLTLIKITVGLMIACYVFFVRYMKK